MTKKATTSKRTTPKAKAEHDPNEGTGITDGSDFLIRKLPTRRRWPIVMDSLLVEARDVLLLELDPAEKRLQELVVSAQIRMRGGGKLSDAEEAEIAEAKATAERLRAEVGKAQQAIDDATTWFVVGAVPKPFLAQLRDEHPPTDEQIAEFRAQREAAGERADGKPEFDREAVAVPLLAEAILTPQFTPEQVDELWNGGSCSEAELEGLLDAALAINRILRI